MLEAVIEEEEITIWPSPLCEQIVLVEQDAYT